MYMKVWLYSNEGTMLAVAARSREEAYGVAVCGEYEYIRHSALPNEFMELENVYKDGDAAHVIKMK